MKRNEVLKNQIERFLKKEQLSKHEEHKKLEKPFLAKSRKNFSVAIINDINISSVCR